MCFYCPGTATSGVCRTSSHILRLFPSCMQGRYSQVSVSRVPFVVMLCVLGRSVRSWAHSRERTAPLRLLCSGRRLAVTSVSLCVVVTSSVKNWRRKAKRTVRAWYEVKDHSWTVAVTLRKLGLQWNNSKQQQEFLYILSILFPSSGNCKQSL